MKRIIVTERDLTSNVEVLSSYDVAYVPGFTSSELGLQYYHKPTLFTNKYEFQKAVGYSPARFTETQMYPEANKETSTVGFSSEAIPEDKIMFNANASDIGYRIALYLLSLGLPVYYEVMNKDLTEVNVATMYAGLTERFSASTDVSFDTPGDYVVKFLTTGGYPVFEYGTAKEQSTTHVGPIQLTEDNWNASEHTITFTYKIGSTAITPKDTDSITLNINGTPDAGTLFEVSIIDGTTMKFTQKPKGEHGDEYDDFDITKATVEFDYIGKPGEEGKVDVSMTIMAGMLNVAQTRGDAIALIDHTNNPGRKLTVSDESSVISVCRSQCVNDDSLDYGAMFTPWYECESDKISNDSIDSFVPGSVAYLSALAVQLRDYTPWLAVSGVTRGKVPNLSSLHTVDVLTNNIADSYQTIPGESAESLNIVQMSINPITYIRGVGWCIWGNRTLRNNSDGTTALSFLNIRSAVSDVKKLIYETSQKLLFEQNTDVTWVNFKDSITPLLERMVSNYILQDYSIVRYLIDPESGNTVPAYKVLGVVKIQPINSIEVFDLTVQLENTSVSSATM